MLVQKNETKIENIYEAIPLENGLFALRWKELTNEKITHNKQYIVIAQGISDIHGFGRIMFKDDGEADVFQNVLYTDDKEYFMDLLKTHSFPDIMEMKDLFVKNPYDYFEKTNGQGDGVYVWMRQYNHGVYIYENDAFKRVPIAIYFDYVESNLRFENIDDAKAMAEKMEKDENVTFINTNQRLGHVFIIPAYNVDDGKEFSVEEFLFYPPENIFNQWLKIKFHMRYQLLDMYMK